MISTNIADIKEYCDAYKKYMTEGNQSNTSSDHVLDHKTPNVDKFLSENIHIVWHGHFKKCFPDWNLIAIDSQQKCILASMNTFERWSETAKIRMICDECGNIWTKNRGKVDFFYDSTSRTVLFFLPGDKCSSSSCSSGNINYPTWYPVEVMCVLENLKAYVSGGEIARNSCEKSHPFRRHHNSVIKKLSESYEPSLVSERDVSVPEIKIDCDLNDRFHDQYSSGRGSLLNSPYPSSCVDANEFPNQMKTQQYLSQNIVNSYLMVPSYSYCYSPCHMPTLFYSQPYYATY